MYYMIIFKVQCFTFKMPYFYSGHPMNNKESPCIVWACACHPVHGASLQTYVCMAGHWTCNPCTCRLKFQGRPYTRWPQHGHHWLTPCKHNAFSQNHYSYSLVKNMHALPHTLFLAHSWLTYGCIFFKHFIFGKFVGQSISTSLSIEMQSLFLNT